MQPRSKLASVPTILVFVLFFIAYFNLLLGLFNKQRSCTMLSETTKCLIFLL